MKPKLLAQLMLIHIYGFSQNINLFPDAQSPFIHGVTSGTPKPQSVVLWTRISPEHTSDFNFEWEIASDVNFQNIIDFGSGMANSDRDYTVHVTAQNLQPDTYYFYRFKNGENYSALGRTKTAPAANSKSPVKFAIMSCSSLFSGYFNAYRRIAERQDLNAIVHLGDYIYDFVDPDERVRIPQPEPSNPVTKEDWWERHKLYLLDPDLREARAMHPWVVIWDNHDVLNSANPGAIEAFWDYLPLEKPNLNNNKIIYNKLSFGKLVDLFMIDVLLHRNKDTLASGERSILGFEQRAWLENGLKNSNATWKVIGNQKMVCGWSSAGIPSWIPIPNDGGVFDRGSWDGFMEDRASLFNFFRNENINDIIFISGDAHISIAADLHEEPMSSAYNATTGQGSVGVEFLPSSISRGNLDEMSPIFGTFQALFTGISNSMNPQHLYSEFTSHGWGLLELYPDSAVVEFRYSNILAPTNVETMAKRMMVKKGENHWYRPGVSNIETLGDGINGLFVGNPYPNPTNSRLNIHIGSAENVKVTIEIFDLNGKLLATPIVKDNLPKNLEKNYSIDITNLAQGTYIITVETCKKNKVTKRFVKN